MKKLLLITTLTLILSACGNRKNEKRYLPNEVDSGVYFNMPVSEFKTLKGNKIKLTDDGMDFREVYFENIEGSKIDYYAYYFDADNEKPFYEIIIGYNDEEIRNSEAIKLLGAPNYKTTEWQFEREKSYDIIAWPHKNKLVIAALIPGTEWYEELNPE